MFCYTVYAPQIKCIVSVLFLLEPHSKNNWFKHPVKFVNARISDASVPKKVVSHFLWGLLKYDKINVQLNW